MTSQSRAGEAWLEGCPTLWRGLLVISALLAVRKAHEQPPLRPRCAACFSGMVMWGLRPPWSRLSADPEDVLQGGGCVIAMHGT